MLPILLAMLLIVGLAALVVLYVAYPRRGAEVPRLRWVGATLQRSVDALPTLDNRDRSEPGETPEDAGVALGGPGRDRQHLDV